jgi:hypothetical protein
MHFESKLTRQLPGLAAHLAFFSWLLLLVDGLSPQLQMFLSHGYVPVHPLLKPLFLTSVLTLAFFRKKTLALNFLKLWLIFVLYIVCHAVYFVFVNKYDFAYLLNLYAGQYFLLLLLPVFPSLSGSIPPKTIYRTLKILFIPLAILGAAQHFFNATIVPPISCDHYLNLQNYVFHGNVRAFSLFSQLFSAGQYFLLVGVSSLICVIKSSKSRYINMIFAVLSWFLVYVTFTRTVYLAAIFSLFSLLILFGICKSEMRINKYIPLYYLLAGLILVGTLTFSVYCTPASRVSLNAEVFKISKNLKSIPLRVSKDIMSAGNISLIDSVKVAPPQFQYFRGDSISESQSKTLPFASQDSYLVRLAQWKAYWTIGFKDAPSFLLGTGYMPATYVLSLKDFCLDNTYLDVFAQIGMIGLLLVSLIYWQFWQLISNIVLASPSPFGMSSLVLFSTLPIVGFFMTGLNFYFIIGILVFLDADNNSELIYAEKSDCKNK